MLEVKIIYIKKMKKEKLLIKLLNEGTIVYKPVMSTLIKSNIYQIDKENEYDSEDEKWEFLPGEIVFVEEKIIDNKKLIIAIKKVERFI